MKWLYGTTKLMDMNLSKLGRQWKIEEPGELQSMESQTVRNDLVTEQQQHQQEAQLSNHPYSKVVKRVQMDDKLTKGVLQQL